jgi:hypothetical protein
VNVRIARDAWIWSFVQPSEARLWTWAWIWSWDPLGCATPSAAPPQPRPGKTPAGQDPKAGLGRSKSRQQRSDQTRKPVKSEQHSCSSTAQAGYGLFYKHVGGSNPLRRQQVCFKPNQGLQTPNSSENPGLLGLSTSQFSRESISLAVSRSKTGAFSHGRIVSGLLAWECESSIPAAASQSCVTR